MSQLWSRDYAQKIGEALERTNCTTVALAFQNALHRKMGLLTTPIPDIDNPDATDGQRFEYLFDTLFEVAPEQKPLEVSGVREIFLEARSNLAQNLENVKKSKRDRDLVELYQADLADYDEILALLDQCKEAEAAQKFMNLDTAAREWASGKTPGADYRFGLWLDEHDPNGTKHGGLPNINLMAYQGALSEAI